ncbi:hypothetical protein GH714_015223 [Hevea brasiliensis]|uniref:Vacuolar protein sorting-associated protein 54 N-terminal domain-containing protein n=1 Tax=Hevea brasiliensis TaxID=3981 RepID=A0A6A6LH02_HEVBR|nr:hypothetical protein GH714_015223 [Hevea brasiliensis]
MDLSKVGEKILSSVRSARSLGLLPSTSDRPEVFNPVFVLGLDLMHPKFSVQSSTSTLGSSSSCSCCSCCTCSCWTPPHQQFSLPSSSEELRSIYGCRSNGQVVEELEEGFYEEDFDPIRHILEHIPSEENELEYFEKQAALRLAQLDRVAEHLSHQVMEHHKVMVNGMNLVRELEKDSKVASVICMNGRRHLTSSRNEVSRDLIVNSNSKKKQALLDVLPILSDLHHALDMQAVLESLVEEGNYCKAFQVLSEYLLLLDGFSELSAIQEMSRGVEVWLGRTLQKLDSLLLGVCQEFKEESYINVVDAYALIGDISGLAEKIQSFFMQKVLSKTHSVLKNIVQEDQEVELQNSSDLCLQIPDSKFRQCLLRTLAVLFRLMCSYYEIMIFQLENKVLASQQIDSVTGISSDPQEINGSISKSADDMLTEESITTVSEEDHEGATNSIYSDSHYQVDEARSDSTGASSSGSPWYQLRKDATAFVSQTLQRGQKNFWQLTTSRVSVLLSSSAVGSMSIHQFLKNYEDLNVFILAGDTFCGVEAVEFRQKLKALKMVLEKAYWLKLPSNTIQAISFAGLVGDGAPFIFSSSSNSTNTRLHHSDKSLNLVDPPSKKNGFASWLGRGNPFLLKLMHTSREAHSLSLPNGAISGEYDGHTNDGYLADFMSPKSIDANHSSGTPVSEDENEDLLADFIDEDSQLPSRISKPNHSIRNSALWKNNEITA